jgi:hypothetical protein
MTMSDYLKSDDYKRAEARRAIDFHLTRIKYANTKITRERHYIEADRWAGIMKKLIA